MVGFALGSVLFIQRMCRATAVADETPFVGRDLPDDVAPRGRYDEAQAADPEVVVYRVSGALFFGATASIGALLDRIARHPPHAGHRPVRGAVPRLRPAPT